MREDFDVATMPKKRRQSQKATGTPKKRVVKAPAGFTKVKQADFIVKVRLGSSRADVIEQMGLKPVQIVNFIDGLDEFREKVEAAELAAVEQALFKGAMEGKTIAQKTFLEMRGAKRSTSMGAGFEPEEPKAAEPADPFADGSNVTPLRSTGRG